MKNRAEDDPEDQFRGDCWGHVAFNPVHRLDVAVIQGERTAEPVQQLVADVNERVEGRVPALRMTDEYTPYQRRLPRSG